MAVSCGSPTASKVAVEAEASAEQDTVVIDWSKALTDWRQVINDPREVKVFTALDNPDWDWRTFDGIQKDAGLPADEIRRILGKYAVLIRSSQSSKHGPVYQLRNRTTQTAEPFIDRALDFISMGKRRKIA